MHTATLQRDMFTPNVQKESVKDKTSVQEAAVMSSKMLGTVEDPVQSLGTIHSAKGQEPNGHQKTQSVANDKNLGSVD